MSAQTDTLPQPLPAPPAEDATASTPRIVPLRRTGQWAAAVAVLALLAAGLTSVVRNDAFQWDVVADHLTTASVLRGLGLTLWLTALVMALGFALGTLLAMGRLSRNPVLRSVSWGYIWLFRSTPILVQLLFWFNIGALYPQILGVDTVHLLGPMAVAVIGLTLHEAAYAAEVVRGGILSVERGQLEAAQSLGLGPWRRLRRIVLPQAMRAIVPPAGNMLIGTLKGTSIVSIIAVQDLLYSVQLVYHRTYQVIPLLLVATLWYVAVTSLLSVGQYYVERRYARGTAEAR
ncbi:MULTISPECIES: amino acid ABC transporter permease [unclassified Streptomyces]|uniref:amino acid ABC transporter permease n=1 Tax=Streptomyces TaxID=1883 RepID=UPI0001C18FAB|nr:MULTISPECIES: amino acid ABC transporter permease [unclassified Streptomyces]AEN09098.1 polar amino acid ABC transporter, inner membrane subunit [Streptomyces sp. SirexAA-E]MYR68943.1 ABC transporter permease subunit [Streptomyces sp. SID4939]MYS01325.1 ABC transporter permease subunit [Streptomyces sp. SID4940]MYT62477.1 ABC transporter permease subunit [Streptomyces sp. SID8357]MYT85479.1 ABC transporter permease subunit [Streptomyces sp. SID8360]